MHPFGSIWNHQEVWKLSLYLSINNQLLLLNIAWKMRVVATTASDASRASGRCYHQGPAYFFGYLTSFSSDQRDLVIGLMGY
jgi:cyanate permease